MFLKALRIVVILFASTTVALAQSQSSSPYSALSSSPYSAIGIGDVQFGGNVQQTGLGRIGQGMRRPFELNTQNPASYGGLRLTCLESAFQYSTGTLSSNKGSTGIENYSYGYLTMGFPISQKLRWGMSAGLLPLSTIGYSVASENSYDGGAFTATQRLQGRGGISKFYGGMGMGVLKNLSVGVNVAYLFGQISSRQVFQVSSVPNFTRFNFEQNRLTYVGGFAFDYGLQYHRTFNRGDEKDQYEFCAGLTLNLPQGISATQDFNARTLAVGTSSGVRDTVANETDRKGTVDLPLAVKAGITFAEKDFWTAGVDAGFTKWEDFRFFGSADSLRNSFSVSVGGSIIPKYNDYKSYLRRIEYRLGGRYDNGAMVFGGTAVQLYGVSAGMGLPLGKSRSRVNLSFEYFVKGTHDNNLLKEEYFRLMIGITVSDRWFQRFQYD